MNIRSIILILSLFLFNTVNAQVFWTENFDGTSCAAGSGCDPSIVSWLVVSQGAEGASANKWYVSDREAGLAPPSCGVSGGGDQSLHIGNVSTSTAAFIFCPTGDCGAAYDDSGPGEITNKRAESPTINCTGQASITVDFNFIENGQGAFDDCSFWYFDGAVWANLNPMAKTPGGCAPQGQWTSVVTINLPASADNNPNVKIGFLWINNGDGTAADPSVAIDDITLTNNSVICDATITQAGPFCIDAPSSNLTAAQGGGTWTGTGITNAVTGTFNPATAGAGNHVITYTLGCGDVDTMTILVNPLPTVIANASPATTVCNGDMVTLTGAGASSYTWDNGAVNGVPFPAVSTLTYTVTGTDVNGCENTDQITITVNPLPTVIANASPTTTVCNGDMVTLTGGGASSYAWDNGAVDGVPFPAVSTLTYTVTGTDVNGCENTDQITITVNNCSSPTASFIPDSLTICVGGDILFTDNSTGSGISSWSWTFPGGIPATANTQGPHNVSFAATGSYNINLSVTDSNGVDDTTIVVNVINCTSVNAAFNMSSSIICAGDSIVFTDASSAGVTIWAWDFDSTGIGGVTPPTAINQGPHTVFYNNPGTYTIQLIVYDGSSFDTTSNTITVNDCSPTANFSASQTILCETDCITFTNLSTGSPTNWSWYFPGGTPSTASGANPGTICYNTAGIYYVSLTVSNQYGTDSLYTTNLITVNICAAPTASITMDDADGEVCINNCIDFSYNGGSGGTPTTINWTFPGGTPSSSSALNPGTVCWNDTTGIFNVTLSVSNVNGSSNASTTVTVHQLPVINAGMDTSITIGSDCNLSAIVTDTAGNILSTAGGVFNWSPITDLSCAICQNTTVIQPLATNSYIITYTDIYGCQVSDTITVNVDIAFNIGVPSAFSPNGDGSNDFLLVKGAIVIKSMNFTIYNRYGQDVFQTTDVTEGWDGKHNGKELNPGVFVYYLNVTFLDSSTKQLKGNVTLVR